METSAQPAPNLAEAKTFFQVLLQQLRHTRQQLPEGVERMQLDEVIVSLDQPLQAVIPAAEQAQAEMAALRQRSQELLQQASAAIPAELAALPSSAGLGTRLREEVLRRYGTKPDDVPDVKPPPVDDDRITGDPGSIASQWQETEGSVAHSVPPAKPADAPAEGGKPTRTRRRPDHDADAWDDLSRAEE